MATGTYTIEIQGLQEYKRAIVEAPEKIRKLIAAEVNDGIGNMQRMAKASAPADQGILRNRINRTVASAASDDIQAEMTSEANYAAYQEFGTGSRASIPPDLTEYASQFWTHKPHKGIPAHPYFFQAVKRFQPVIEENILRQLAKI